jgi:hypothetical protein
MLRADDDTAPSDNVEADLKDIQEQNRPSELKAR